MERLEPGLAESSRNFTFYRDNKKIECDERDVDSPLKIWELHFLALFKNWKKKNGFWFSILKVARSTLNHVPPVSTASGQGKRAAGHRLTFPGRGASFEVTSRSQHDKNDGFPLHSLCITTTTKVILSVI